MFVVGSSAEASAKPQANGLGETRIAPAEGGLRRCAPLSRSQAGDEHAGMAKQYLRLTYESNPI